MISRLLIAELHTLLIAMAPIGELRASIPIAIGVYHIPALPAYFFSVVGNLIPVVFILLFLEKVSDYLSHRNYYFNRFFAWLFEKTRRRHQKKFRVYKEFALLILVAIPLPFTGAWTGSLCAFVFGIPIRKAFPLISIGVAIAGIIVTLLSINFLPLK